MVMVAEDFVLCADFYDEGPEKKRLMENPYWDSEGRDEIKDKEWYWKNKHLSKCEYMHADWDFFIPEVYIRLPAPMEKQPYPEFINCEKFTEWRKKSLEEISGYQDPRTHGFLTQLSIPSGHPDAIWPENSEGTEFQAEIILGKRFYKKTLMAWLKKTKSDVEFQRYFDGETYCDMPKPKLWREEYLGYDNYCPFEPGEYLSDGVYASESWAENNLFLYKLSDEGKTYDPETGEEIDGW